MRFFSTTHARALPRAQAAPWRSIATLFAGLLASLVLALAAAPAQAQGFANMRVWNTTHCLDSARENYTKAQMWSCDHEADDMWVDMYNPQDGTFTFLNQLTGRCLSAPAWGTGVVTIQLCNAALPTQQWRVYYANNPSGPPSGWYQVWQNVSSGYCLGTNSVGNGTVIQTFYCNSEARYQRWHKGD